MCSKLDQTRTCIMNTLLAPGICRSLILVLLVLAVGAVAVPAVCAAPSAAAVVMPAVLPAFDMMDIVHDRARLVQFSIVAVAIGIGLLWWGQKY
jgi:hypothetical protein